MIQYVGCLAIVASLGLSACAADYVFPTEVMKGVDRSFDFPAWRIGPSAYADRKVQLGGRIVQTEVHDGTILIVTSQLPIVEHPMYGPQDTGKRSGEFAILFHGAISPTLLQTGNRVVVVGTTQVTKVVSSGDSPRQLPAVTAQCVHLWNTGGREISEFPSFSGGYEPLEELTACASDK